MEKTAILQKVDPCVTFAIQRQVHQEDLQDWASRPQEEFTPVPGIPYVPFKRAPLQTFLSKILP